MGNSLFFGGIVKPASTKNCLPEIDNFLSEVVRCGASQKKHLRDSTKAYSPKVFTI